MQTANYRTELSARLRLVTEDLAWVVRGATEEQTHYKPADYEWSLHEHLSHLRDMEQEVYLPLLRWATVPDMLDPVSYSRKLWRDLRYSPDERVAEILEDLKRIRDEELTVLSDMTDEAWTRYRTETRWGPLTCQSLAEIMYRNALEHLAGAEALVELLDGQDGGHVAARRAAPRARVTRRSARASAGSRSRSRPVRWASRRT